MKLFLPFQRIMAVAEKEWIQIRRDTRSLILTMVAPAFLVLLFGYALNMDVKNVSIAVFDQDRTSFSRQFVEKFTHTEYLSLNYRVDKYRDIDGLIDRGKIALALVIPVDFTRKIKSGRNTDIQLLVDGSDSMTSTVALGYVRAILAQFNIETRMEGLNKAGVADMEMPIDVRNRIWYNEELQSKNYVIPGLIVIILALVSALITSLTISREWERGTMETLITTPVRPFEVMTGKLLPYMVIGSFNVVLTFLVGHFVFDIQLRGSFLELMALAILFLMGMSALGILISAATKIQVLSIQAAMIVTYLPSFILSGFIFPVKNMPVLIQGITYLIPAKYMIVLIKGIVLKGIPASMMMTQIIFMIIFTLVVFLLSLKKFRLTMPD